MAQLDMDPMMRGAAVPRIQETTYTGEANDQRFSSKRTDDGSGNSVTIGPQRHFTITHEAWPLENPDQLPRSLHDINLAHDALTSKIVVDGSDIFSGEIKPTRPIDVQLTQELHGENVVYVARAHEVPTFESVAVDLPSALNGFGPGLIEFKQRIEGFDGSIYQRREPIRNSLQNLFTTPTT